MKKALLLLVLVLFLLPTDAFCQANAMIQDVWLGTIRASTTSYGKYGGVKSAGTTTYEEILANPKLICDKPGCEVTHFTITILPKGADLLGPFSTAGSELSPKTKRGIGNLTGATPVNAKMIIDSIEVSCNGTNKLLRGSLLYSIK